MGVLQVEVIAGSIEIGRHHRDEGGTVLPVVGVAHFDAGDLGDSVGRIGRLQRPGQERVLPDRLGGALGIDAGAAEEDQPFHAGQPGLVDDVDLHRQVFVNELPAIDVVGVNAADLGGGEEHAVRAFGSEETGSGGLIEQIEFGVTAQQQVLIALSAQDADQGGADQATMTGDVDFGVRIHAGIHS